MNKADARRDRRAPPAHRPLRTDCRLRLWPVIVLLNMPACADRPNLWELPSHGGSIVSLDGVTFINDRPRVDFGSVPIAESAVGSITLHNTLGVPLLVGDIRITAQTASAFAFRIGPAQANADAAGRHALGSDQSLALELQFAPEDAGPAAATLTLHIQNEPAEPHGAGGCSGSPVELDELSWHQDLIVELQGTGTPTCADRDGDGYLAGPAGISCTPADCDDAAATCMQDCETDADSDGLRDCDDPCADSDGDGAGTSNLTDGNTCTGTDCDDQVATCTNDCTTDADQDGRRDCDDPCIDADEDGFGLSLLAQGGTCAGPDCDDAAAACTTDCSTDRDADGLRDCDDPCVDADADDYGTGPDCRGADCDDTIDDCTLTCEDADADELRDCDADPCVDADGDGYGRSDRTPGGCVADDCDDAVAPCTVDCLADADQDGIPDCRDDCVDGDQDGYGEGPGCEGSDCNDAAFLCTSNCEDRDRDDAADCAANCRDRDRDGFGEPPYLCDCGLLDCNDCDPEVPTCTVDCAADADLDGQDDCTAGPCADADGDGWSDCKDACIDMDGDGWGDPDLQNSDFIGYCDDLTAQGLQAQPHCAVRCAGADCDDSDLRCNADCTSDSDGDHVPDCKDECQDPDGDGYGEDIVPGGCLGEDCDETYALCNVDCTSDADGDGIPNCRDGCVDNDGDGYGQGACNGSDCDETEVTCNVDCTTDMDEDGQSDCKDSCIDVDGDTHGTGTGCAGPDCDETSEICNADCTDVDDDAIFDCKDTCIDPDRDTFGSGSGCAGQDCLEGNAFCNVDCSDTDSDGEPDCAGACIDVDGDSYCADAPDHPDCDDEAPSCWFGTHDCETDADSDGLRDCDDLCIDFDGDQYGLTLLPAGTAGICNGTDCDEGYATCNTDCTANLDSDPYPDCRDTCIDPDNDGYGDGTVFGDTCLGGDCLADGAEDPAVWAGHPELCNGKDDDCDGQTDEAEVAVDDAQLCEDQSGVCLGAAKPSVLCVSGQWQPCTAAQYLQHDAAFQAGTETRCDMLDNDCSGQTDEDFQALEPDGTTVRRISDACGFGVCQGGHMTCNGQGTGLTCNSWSAIGAEICDNLDNDCDGRTDTADTSLLRPYCENQTGVCSGCFKFPSLCVGGSWQVCSTVNYLSCAPLSSYPNETCNNLDDDCDGQTDASDASLIRPACALTAGVCAGCFKPTALCSGGTWGACTTATYQSCSSYYEPTEQTCNDTRDNDCDGALNCNDANCSARACNDSNVCTGNETCQSSPPSCQPGTEACCTDDNDNDNDGQTDCSDVDCTAQCRKSGFGRGEAMGTRDAGPKTAADPAIVPALQAPLWAWPVDRESEALPLWPLAALEPYAERFRANEDGHSATGYAAPGHLAVIVWADPEGWLRLVLTLSDGWQEPAHDRCRVAVTAAYDGCLPEADDPAEALEVDGSRGAVSRQWAWASGDGAVVGAFEPAELCVKLAVSACDEGIDGLRLYWGERPEDYYGLDLQQEVVICGTAALR